MVKINLEMLLIIQNQFNTAKTAFKKVKLKVELNLNNPNVFKRD